MTCHKLKSRIFLYIKIFNHIKQWLKKYAMHESRATQNQTILWITLWLTLSLASF